MDLLHSKGTLSLFRISKVSSSNLKCRNEMEWNEMKRRKEMKRGEKKIERKVQNIKRKDIILLIIRMFECSVMCYVLMCLINSENVINQSFTHFEKYSELKLDVSSSRYFGLKTENSDPSRYCCSSRSILIFDLIFWYSCISKCCISNELRIIQNGFLDQEIFSKNDFRPHPALNHPIIRETHNLHGNHGVFKRRNQQRREDCLFLDSSFDLEREEEKRREEKRRDEYPFFLLIFGEDIYLSLDISLFSSLSLILFLSLSLILSFSLILILCL